MRSLKKYSLLFFLSLMFPVCLWAKEKDITPPLSPLEKNFSNLGNQDEKSRRQAVLFMIEHRFEALPFAIKALKSKNWRARCSGLEILWKIGSLALKAVPDIYEALKDPHWRIHILADRVLLKIANQKLRFWCASYEIVGYCEEEEAYLKQPKPW